MQGTQARSTHLRVILAVVVLGAAVQVVLGLALLVKDSPGGQLPAATPLHPVAGDFEPDRRTLDDCDDDQGCLEQAFGNVAFREGPRKALALLETRYPDLADTACHRAVHTIGSASLARNKGDIAKTFAQGSSSCSSGYYHGVLERSLVRVTSRRAGPLAEVARDLCAGRAVESSLWLRFQCLHGLGHGLMIATGYTLPLVLDVCNRLRTPWEETSCNGGAFMENIATSYGVTSRWLRDDDPVYPCNTVAEEDKLKCYELATSRIVRVLDGDWEKTAQACSEVEKGWVWACFRSFGRDVAGKAHYQPSETLPLCALARPHGYERVCVSAAAEVIAANYQNGVQASALCRAAPRDFAAQCYSGIGTILVRIVDDLRNACSAIATRTTDISACVSGGRRYLRWIERRR
jgi:hypothetical protein